MTVVAAPKPKGAFHDDEWYSGWNAAITALQKAMGEGRTTQSIIDSMFRIAGIDDPIGGSAGAAVNHPVATVTPCALCGDPLSPDGVPYLTVHGDLAHQWCVDDDDK